jgi:flavin-binding protein dodecin
MTGYQVQGGALLAHSQGSQEAADQFGQLASLLEQARVSDDCFGPLGELMAFKYFEGLKECQDMANKAKGFLEGVSERTEQTAQTYRDVEDAIQQGLTRASKTLRNIRGAWIKEQHVRCDNGRITEYQVNMMVTFVLDDDQTVNNG